MESTYFEFLAEVTGLSVAATDPLALAALAVQQNSLTLAQAEMCVQQVGAQLELLAARFNRGVLFFAPEDIVWTGMGTASAPASAPGMGPASAPASGMGPAPASAPGMGPATGPCFYLASLRHTAALDYLQPDQLILMSPMPLPGPPTFLPPVFLKEPLILPLLVPLSGAYASFAHWCLGALKGPPPQGSRLFYFLARCTAPDPQWLWL